MALLGLNCSMRELSCSMWNRIPWPGFELWTSCIGSTASYHWIIREVSEMQVIEPHPSLTKSETLESSRTSPPGDSSVPRGGEPGLPRGGGAGEWALWAWAEISTFISRIMGSFWKVLKHRYKTIRFMLFKKFHLKKDVWQHSCLENSMDRGAWHVVVHWSCRVGHNWATNSIHYLYKMGNIASIL